VKFRVQGGGGHVKNSCEDELPPTPQSRSMTGFASVYHNLKSVHFYTLKVSVFYN